jgi:hypothetical protein
MSLTRFRNADDIVSRFLALLTKHGITPPVNSGIEAEMLSVTELLELTKNPSAVVGRPSLLAEAGGIFDLAAKVLAISSQPEFSSFIPHLRLFASRLPLASVAQTTPGHATDDVHRKISELYLGSLAVHVGTNVALDHPTSAAGDNPDVLFDATKEKDDSKKRWALAIKTISSRSGQTIFERISEASGQINASACPADRGMVVINTQGALKPETLWPIPFQNLEDALEALKKRIRELADASRANRPVSDWESTLSGRTSPIVLYMGHAVVRVDISGHDEVPTVIKMLYVDNPTETSDDEAESIAGYLNEYMQYITKGIPGSDGRNPE